MRQTNYTKTTLQTLVDRLNRITESPAKPYAQDEQGILVPQLGNWHVTQQLGGYCVARIVTSTGGCSEPIWSGHVAAKEACTRLDAFLKGLTFLPKV